MTTSYLKTYNLSAAVMQGYHSQSNLVDNTGGGCLFNKHSVNLLAFQSIPFFKTEQK